MHTAKLCTRFPSKKHEKTIILASRQARSATTVEKAKMNLHGAITDALRDGPGPHTSWSAPGTARAMQGSRGPQPIH